jgi:hypothetical protein
MFELDPVTRDGVMAYSNFHFFHVLPPIGEDFKVFRFSFKILEFGHLGPILPPDEIWRLLQKIVFEKIRHYPRFQLLIFSRSKNIQGSPDFINTLYFRVYG